MSRAWPAGWPWNIFGMVAEGRRAFGSSIQRAIQSVLSRAPASARFGASVASSGIPPFLPIGRGRGVALEAAKVGDQLAAFAELEAVRESLESWRRG